MSLQDKLANDVKQAMRDKNHIVRDTLRMVLADMKNKRIELGRDLEEGDELAVMKRAAKTRQDSFEQYTQAGREELAAQEKAEIEVLQAYLPKTLSEDDTRAAVKAIVDELGFSTKKEMGALMKALMSRHKGLVDGKVAQSVAAELLS